MSTQPDFKPGDIAIVIEGTSRATAHVVARLTKTRVVLDDDQWFPRDRLWRRTEYGWHQTRYLVKPDDPRVAKVLAREHEEREDALARRVNLGNFGVTLDDVRRVIAIADAHLDLHDTDEDLRACENLRRAFMPQPRTVDALTAVARASAKLYADALAGAKAAS